MHSLRSTERHLILLKLPFGLKPAQRKTTLNRRYYAAYNQSETRGLRRKYNGSHQSRSIRVIESNTQRPLTTSTIVKVPLINPDKPTPENSKDVILDPITPASMPRFPKHSEVLPSVTKILSATMPASSQFLLDRWKESMIKKLGVAGFNKYQQDTFERGRLLHALIASYLMGQGEPTAITKDIVANLWKSIQNVVRENIKNVRLVEHAVTHREMKYRGIVDCVAFYKNELVVIDFKTAEKPKKSVESLFDNPLQITAYCGAINNDETIPRSIIDRNICAGLVIVAYIDGSEASVYYIGREKLLDEYWDKWTTRLDRYTQMEVMRLEQNGKTSAT